MQKYGDLDLFPVKITLPLILSMKITLNVKHICMWGASGADARKTCSKAPIADMRRPPAPSFFAVPDGYAEKSLEEHSAFHPAPAAQAERQGGADGNGQVVASCAHAGDAQASDSRPPGH